VKVTAKVEGLERLILDLRDRARKATENRRVSVGYSAPYSVFVHENLQVHHPNGSAKFLEQPAREKSAEVALAVRSAVGRGQPVVEALRAGGEALLAASQQLVPVLTGNLRSSGYVRVE
jgi:hypothetical protein